MNLIQVVELCTEGGMNENVGAGIFVLHFQLRFLGSCPILDPWMVMK